MSIDAIRWAFQQPVKPASAKFVLVTIADRAGEDHCAYPSIRRIVFDTGLNRKTVLQAVQLLMKVGLLERTGEMRGATDSVPVYRLIGVPDRSNPEIGTGPESGTGKQYRNSPEAVSLFHQAVPIFPQSSPRIGTLNLPRNHQGNLPMNRSAETELRLLSPSINFLNGWTKKLGRTFGRTGRRYGSR